MSDAFHSIFRLAIKGVCLGPRASIRQRQFPVARKREATDPRARYLEIKSFYDRFNQRSENGRKVQ